MTKRSLITLCFFLLALQVSATDSLPSRPLTVAHLAGKIRLDGIPDEAEWQSVPSLQFHVLDPLWGSNPVERTEMRFLYDESNLYVGGKCFYKDTSQIILRNFVRDGWRGDDWVAVHIDSRFDHQTAINFAIYPAGSRYDMLISNDAVDLGGSSTNQSFNAVWDARSVITREGWFFEMKIPLFNLRYKTGADGTAKMAISVTRWTAYNNELQHSVPIPQGISSGFLRPSLKQEMMFNQLKRHKLLLVTPYVSASATETNPWDEVRKTVLRDKNNRFNAGLDVKLGISQRLTLDATINPDFGQAEADVQQLNLTRFGLYLPERRLFFQEQSGLFDFGIGNTAQLFYSRRIGLSEDGVIPLYAGLRLTGQLDNTTDVGLLSMQSAPKRFSDSVHMVSENFGVVRLRKKILNSRSFAGVLFTNRNSSAESSYSLGADAVLNLRANDYLKIGFAATQTRSGDDNKPAGIASSRISVSWESIIQKGLIPKFGYIYSGENFDPRIGFLDRTGFHGAFASLAYGVFAKTDKQLFSRQKFSLISSLYSNAASGRMESINAGPQWYGYTAKGASFTVSAAYNYEYLKESIDFGNAIIAQPGIYRFPSFSVKMAPPESRKIAFPAEFGGGGFFGGQRYFASVSSNLNSARTVHVQPGYDYTYLYFDKSSSGRHTHIHIARVKFSYAPDLHFNVAANIQYNSAEQKIFSNFRLRYNFSDGHDLYVVWNNDSRTSRFMEGKRIPATEQQQFLVKYYYTFSVKRR